MAGTRVTEDTRRRVVSNRVRWRWANEFYAISSVRKAMQRRIAVRIVSKENAAVVVEPPP
jgi:hypothetical protein